MITKPSQEQFRAIARLTFDDDFQVFMRYLEKCQQDIGSKLIVSEEDRILRQQQGAAQVLKELQHHVKEAPEHR